MTTTACGCDFASLHPTEHDFLLGIEDMGPLKAATYIAMVIGDDDLCSLIEFSPDEPQKSTAMLHDRDDLRRFVGQHNWRDPVAMYELAMDVSEAAGQATRGRHARDGERHRAALSTV
jgi:hypothetical protein